MAKKAYVYNGSAWEDLASSVSDLSGYATTVDLDDYQLKSASGLTLIKTQVIGTAVTSVTVTDAFSATYDNYFIAIAGGAGVGTSLVSLSLQLGTTATGYNGSLVYSTYTSASVLILVHNSAASWLYTGGAETNGIQWSADIFAPFLAKNSRLSTVYGMPELAGVFNGVLTNTTSYTDFTIATPSGNLTGGTIRVYGYQN